MACSELIAQARRPKPKDWQELALIYRRRGSAYLETGKHAEAMADFSEAIRFKPGYALAYYERGQVALALRKHEMAIEDYGTAILHNPRYAPSYIARGYVRLIVDDVDGAIADYSRLIQLEPKNAVALNNRGLALSKKGELDKALADYSAAITINPHYALAYNNRGYGYEAKGKKSEAQADFTKALSIDPTLSGAAAGLKRLGASATATARSGKLVNAGRKLVETNCVTCHATGAKGASPKEKAPPFRAIHNRYPILTLRDPVSRGIAYPHREMPKFTFSGEQIDTIIAFINSLPPGE
jgi:tetratricopeptide (TPR) repeat protein